MSNSVNSPFSQLFKYTSIALAFSLVGFIFGQLFIPPTFARLANMFIGIFFLISFLASFFLKKGNKSFWTINKVYLYAFINGICIYPILNYYAYSLGTGTVVAVFVGTIAVFTGLSILGKSDNSDSILNIGPVLSMILLGIVIASFFNLFLKSNIVNIGISSLAIIVFSIYIVYTVNTFKHQLRYGSFDCADDYAPFVINLYSDFINIFLNVLRLIDSTRDNN